MSIIGSPVNISTKCSCACDDSGTYYLHGARAASQALESSKSDIVASGPFCVRSHCEERAEKVQTVCLLVVSVYVTKLICSVAFVVAGIANAQSSIERVNHR